MTESITNDTNTKTTDRTREAQRTEDAKTGAATQQKVDLDKKIDAKTTADATTVADKVIGSGDGFERAPAAVTRSDGSVVKTDDMGSTTVETGGEDIGKTYDRLSKEMESGDWMKSEDAAKAQADRIKSELGRVPEADRKDFLSGLMRPVDDMVRTGLVDPNSNTPGASPERARIAGAFGDLLGSKSVNALGNALRHNESNPESRNAIIGTLGKVADGNVDPTVRSMAARTIMAGPIDGLKDALSGKIDGLDAKKLADYTDKYGTVDSDQRLLGASEGLDPSVKKELESRGIQKMDLPADNSIVHDALDAAGLVPGLGEPADLLNAGIYGLEGDLKNAAISLGAATGLPLTAARLGGKLLSHSDVAAAGAAKVGKKLGKEEGLIYERFDKHPIRNPEKSIDDYGRIAPAPQRGQAMLDSSVEVSKRTRVAADPVSKEFTVFNLTQGKTWHGHARTWEGLDANMRGNLYRMGLVDRRGRFLVQ